MKRWRIAKKGTGYSGGNRPWWPHYCGGAGYRPDGSVIAYTDLVIFKRVYFRVFEISIPPFETAANSIEMHRIGVEMQDVTP